MSVCLNSENTVYGKTIHSGTFDPFDDKRVIDIRHVLCQAFRFKTGLILL